MKTTLLAMLLLFVAACNETNDNSTKTPLPEEPKGETLEQKMSIIIKNYSDFPAEEISNWIANKSFSLWTYVEYDAMWEKILNPWYVFGDMRCEGLSPDAFFFHPDGRLTRFVSSDAHPDTGGVTYESEWSYDPQSNLLTLFNYSVRLIAADGDFLIWDSYTPDGSGRNYRSIYVVK